MRKRERIVQLESLRGLAALIVVNSHLNLAFAPVLLCQDSADPASMSTFASLLTTTPLNLFFNGSAAVRFFFVHSGFVLSLRHLQERNDLTLLSSAAVRRYFRLAIPVFAANLFAFALLYSHMYRNVDVGSLRGVWIGQFYTFAPDIWAALAEGAYGAFFWFAPVTSYNRVLWTIALELQGSFLVFAFLALFVKARRRWPFELAALALMWNTQFFGFVLGMCLARIYVERDHWSTWVQRVLESRVVLTLSSALGIWLLAAKSSKFKLYEILPESWLSVDTNAASVLCVGAAFLIWGCVHSHWMQRLFGNGVFQTLGRLCYAVYLLHLPVICSFSCWCFLYLVNVQSLSQPRAFWLTAFATHAVVLPLSWLFYQAVDKPAIAVAKRIWERWFAFRTQSDHSSGKTNPTLETLQFPTTGPDTTTKGKLPVAA